MTNFSIDPQDYLKKLVETYQAQCNQYLAERVELQTQLNLVLIELERVTAELDKINEQVTEVDVNENLNT